MVDFSSLSYDNACMVAKALSAVSLSAINIAIIILLQKYAGASI